MMKKKFSTRILLIVLTLATLLTFSACNTPNDDLPETEAPTQAEVTGTQPSVDSGEDQTTAQQENNTTGEPENITTGEPEDDGPDLPDVTYPDTEFKVYIRGWGDDGFDYASDLFVGYSLGATPTAIERAVYERMTMIEDAYGVIFDVTVRDGNLDKSVVENSARTGTDVFDLIVEHGVQTFSFAQKNLLLDYADLPYVDTDQPWWSQDANECFRTGGGKLFAMTGDISFFSVGSTFAMFFNKDVIADVQDLESPYQMVYNDEWTFEVFENYVVTLANNMNGDGSGELGRDSFGYGTAEWRGPVQALYSTGVRTLVRKNDAWTFPLNKEIANNMFFDYRELLFDSGAAFLLNKVDYSALRTAFTSGQVAFFDDNLQAASYFKGTSLNFGLLPWPKYNDDVDGYYSAVDAGTNVYSVLRNTTEGNAERVSVILEALAYYGYRDVMPFYYDTILSYQYLQDDDAIHMLHIIHDNLVFDLGYFLGNVLSGVFRTSIISGDVSTSLSQAYNENIGSAKNAMLGWDALDEEE